MQIECTTPGTALEVLLLLQSADLGAGAFRMTGPHPPMPPIRITFSEAPPADLVEQLRAIPDINIVDMEAA